MSKSGSKTWLLAYDIADPRRLRRVHYLVRRHGCSVQYSAYSVYANDEALGELLRALEGCIEPAVDDIRAYHIPDHCRLWTVGQQNLPEGIIIDAETAARLLLAPIEEQIDPLNPEEVA